MWAKYHPPGNMPHDLSMAEGSPPARLIGDINSKCKSKCSGQNGSRYDLLHRPSRVGPRVISVLVTGLVVFTLSACLGTKGPINLVVDRILCSAPDPDPTTDMVYLTSIRPWAALLPWLLSFVTDAVTTASPTTAPSSSVPTPAADADSYTDWTVTAIETLQTWYDEDEGLWNSTGWWNSANCLTALGDFSALDADTAAELDLNDVFSNTFVQAQKTTTANRKARRRTATRGGASHPVESRQPLPVLAGRDGYPGFINDYYDDEGWWALAWIRAYDVTGVAAYLTAAETIFRDMQGGVNGTCGGGIWWSKDRTYKNAIANELYLAVAASLANRLPPSSSGGDDDYLGIAEAQWAWFRASGMIGADGLINDGLTIYANGTCANNGETVWSYNQGVILGGLVELYRATGNTSLLGEAVDIAEAAIGNLSVGGILHESCEDDGCGADGSQFKGVFMRNLHYLQLEVNQDSFRSFIVDNANSIWANDRNSSDYLGLDWAGPPSAGGFPNASTQSSATDALVAAMAVTSS